MRFVDRVIRSEDAATSARQLASLVGEAELPSFLSPLDRLLVRLGARLGPRLPRLVMLIARRRMLHWQGINFRADSQNNNASPYLNV